MNLRVLLLTQVILATQAAGAQHTVRVQASAAPLWGSNVRLVEEFSVGDKRPDYLVRFPLRVAAEDSGSFYVYDDGDTQIRRYDSRGLFDRKIGQRGKGSGEYQGVSGMQVTRDGLLAVFDHASRRITYFQPDGRMVREIEIGPNYYAGKFAVDTNGFHYLTERLPGPLEGPDARHVYVRISPGGEIVDSIHHPRDVQPPRTGFCLRTSEGRRCSFVRETLVAPWTHGGMVAAVSDRYIFSVIRPDDDTLIVQRSRSSVRIKEQEKMEWVALTEDMTQRPSAGSPPVIPPLKPAIRELFSDNLGRVWVDLYVAADRRPDDIAATDASRRPRLSWRERATYEVFSPDGRFLERLELPWGSMLLAVRGDRVYLLAKKSTEYQLVVCKIVADTAPR